MAESLDQHVGPYYGDILLTADKFFHQFQLLQQTTVIADSDSNYISGGLGGENHDQPMVHLGTKGPLSQAVRDRLKNRLNLPADADDAPDEIFMRFIFAHELGHVIQSDPMFETYFGQIDMNTYAPEAGYSQYVNSDKEANADFIAAVLIGASDLGRELEIKEPGITPDKWRDWAAAHPV